MFLTIAPVALELISTPASQTRVCVAAVTNRLCYVMLA